MIFLNYFTNLKALKLLTQKTWPNKVYYHILILLYSLGTDTASLIEVVFVAVLFRIGAISRFVTILFYLI